MDNSVTVKDRDILKSDRFVRMSTIVWTLSALWEGILDKLAFYIGCP